MSSTDVRRPGRRVVAGVVAIVVVGSILAVLPLGFTLVGAVLLVAALRGEWDPTWNDGDGWFGGGGAVLLVLVLAGTAVAAGTLARVGRLPPRRTASVAVLGTVMGAFAPILLFWIVPRL